MAAAGAVMPLAFTFLLCPDAMLFTAGRLPACWPVLCFRKLHPFWKDYGRIVLRR